MALICANCGAPMRGPGQSISEARCVNCAGTVWRSASFAETAVRGPVIEAVVLPDRRIEPSFRHPRPDRRIALREPPRPLSRRKGLLHRVAEASALIAVSMTIAIGVVFHASIADAFADLTGAALRYDGLEFRAVRTETRYGKAGRTLTVEGEIVNRSSDARPMPAIRMTLRAAGADVYSWTVEPSPTLISAGGAIGFRSVVAPPDERDGEVALTLAERQDSSIRTP